MKKTLLQIDLNKYPDGIKSLFEGACVFDSSCSNTAQVLYVDKDEGYFVKCAEKGQLECENKMAKYFYKKGLGVEVIDYISCDKDYLVTRKADGCDAASKIYLENPKKLCDVLGEGLRALHELKIEDCPVNRMEAYFGTVDENYNKGIFDASIFYNGDISRDEAYRIACENKKYFLRDTLIHGDFCLPNIMLKDFKISAFIDVGNGGMADRHIDLFWGAWSLWYNLKTDKYTDRFFSSYGKDKINADAIRVVSAMECFG